MDAIDPSQFADTPTGLIVGQQCLYLDRGQAPLDLTQLADVRTLRILKLRVRPHLVGPADPLEKPLYQGFCDQTGA